MAYAEPLTVSQVMAKLDELIVRKPEVAGWPIHILDMDDGDDGHRPDEAWDCLVTTIETDMFTEKQGWVVSFCAEREPVRRT